MRCMIVPGRIGRLAVFCLILFSSVALNARERGRVRLVGSIQSDILFQDEDDDAATDDRQLLSNTYVDLMLYGRHLDAGTRIEYMEHPLPGYESDFKGWGVPSLWVKGRLGTTEVTAGSFYEQFGSGMVLRIYENRSLGIDNSLTGGRIVVRPAKGFTAKLLSGRQRRYWSLNDSWVSGADLEVSLGPSITLGGSWVNKYEKDEFILADERHRFNLPEYVNAWDVRGSWNNGPWSLSVEYAGKSQDPSFDNGYSYGKGSAAFVSGSFSRSGMSILLFTHMNETTFFLSLACVAFSFGGTITVFPSLVSDFFGLNNLTKNYGLIYLGFGIGSVLGSLVASVFGGFTVTFSLIMTLLVISLVLSLSIRLPNRQNLVAPVLHN